MAKACQQRQLILCKEFVSRVSEATLENFLVGFWPFPVLHCPCASLCGSPFLSGVSGGSGAAAGPGAKRSSKVAKSMFYQQQRQLILCKEFLFLGFQKQR